jgi:hypothetical protein
MLIILLTKEINVFHSSAQVGLAYMVFPSVERENWDIFSLGYFSCRMRKTPELHTKSGFRPDFELFSGRFSVSQRQNIVGFPLGRPKNGDQRAAVKHIANFVGLPKNPE